ncbi:MAG: hypothetical protein WA892_09000, partial [Ornithinimicrobium sp.]
MPDTLSARPESREDERATVGAHPEAHDGERADQVSFDRDASGRHRLDMLRAHPATLLTAGIAAGSVALAGFAAYGTSQGPDTDTVRASLNTGAPHLAQTAVSGVQDGSLPDVIRGSAEADQAMLSLSAVQSSQDAGLSGAKAAAKQQAKIQAEEEAAAAKRAEEAAAAKRAEEAAAAEQREQESQAASRSAEREAAPEAEAAPEPEAAPAPSGDPRSIAQSMLGSYGWGSDQFGCLDSLWAKESGWNSTASNPSSGAYGIPQSLPGSKMASAGADWQSNPATQIEWGLGYIQSVYGSPCAAWS